jgi:hypothetical protein
MNTRKWHPRITLLIDWCECFPATFLQRPSYTAECSKGKTGICLRMRTFLLALAYRQLHELFAARLPQLSLTDTDRHEQSIIISLFVSLFISTARVSRLGRSQQNVQWIWTCLLIKALVTVRQPPHPHSVATTIAQLLLVICLLFHTPETRFKPG